MVLRKVERFGPSMVSILPPPSEAVPHFDVLPARPSLQSRAVRTSDMSAQVGFVTESTESINDNNAIRGMGDESPTQFAVRVKRSPTLRASPTLGARALDID